MADAIRVLIADDHIIVRSGVRLLLESAPDIQVIGEASDGVEVVKKTEQYRPNVILMDIAMPGMDGMAATHQIKDRWPDIQILILTMHRSDEYFFEALKAGASGYILKAAEPDELISAIQIVARGEVFLYPTMAQKLVQDYLTKQAVPEDSKSILSQRESEILQLLAEGYSNKEIASKLIISPSTVHTHRSNLMHKLGLNNRRELIQYALRRGLLTD